MKRQQIILLAGSTVLLLLIYFFGRTVPAKKIAAKTNTAASDSTHDDHDHGQKIDYPSLLTAAKQKLSPERQAFIATLESAVVRGDVKNQQEKVYRQMATFWKDSIGQSDPYAFYAYAYYTAEAAKLENSEKSLTFAARLFLDNLRGLEEPSLKTLMADQAKELFKKVLEVNPANDSAKIGLGSCYIFGSSAENPGEIMQGIQQILEVSRRDSTNMYAQLMLGIGGMVSGQLDKAIERLLKVVENQPHNLEAILTLAEAYERKGDKAGAVKWYTAAKKQITNPAVVKEIDQRIELLK